MTQTLRAHTPNDLGDWHDLDAHTRDVADAASRNAEAFGASATAHWAGLLHDLGKANPAFQQYLCACEQAKRTGARPPKAGQTPHAIWGAAIAQELQGAIGPAWEDVAVPVAGHHAGIKRPGRIEQELLPLTDRAVYAACVSALAALGPLPDTPEPPPTDPSEREMRVRFVLSALADADYLDTERHFKRAQSDERAGHDAIALLAGRLAEKQATFAASLDDPDSEVNMIRREVYDACRARATDPPGFFRLTVPTGGGKTRSGLAFALDHARANDLDHVVVAIPYTSIIDQTAAIYAGLLGSQNVLVHHSQTPAPPTAGDEDAVGPALRHRLATENWDAPVVVTTTVQLFESLFSRKPGRVRKLHRLARSVIVLDEVQALPPAVLLPTLDALRILVGWGATVVFSSATQPHFENIAALGPMQGQTSTEIVPDHAAHFATLERVRYEPRLDPTPWNDLADEIAGLDRVLVIVNARRDAIRLATRLAETGVDDLEHLSTLLTGAHRRLVLRRVRQRLAAGVPVRLVSTQVVEAGVDLDFPVVYRALGPLDRIIQAAGRCNRENHLGRHGGRVVVFAPEGGGLPPGSYRKGTGLARDLLLHADPHRLATQRSYFQDLYSEPGQLDEYDVQTARLGDAYGNPALDFEETQKRYRLIPDDTTPVLVASGATDKSAVTHRLRAWIEAGERGDWQARRHAWRRLAPFTVSVFDRQLDLLRTSPHFETLGDDALHVWRGTYDPLLGLPLDLTDPADLAYDPAFLTSV